MQPQHVWGEVMQVKDPSDAAMINGESVTGLDDPREFAGAEGVRERQADNLLLDRDRHIGFDRWFPAVMRPGPVIQYTGEAIAAKPLQIPPETLIGEARGASAHMTQDTCGKQVLLSWF